MSYFYSKSTGGFYPASMKTEYDDWPKDTVTVSDADYKKLFSGQSEGKIITADKYGHPVLSDPPDPTQKELIAMAVEQRSILMFTATQTIAILQDAVDLEMATGDEKSQLAAWKKYRVLLSRIDTDNAPDISWPGAPK